MTTSTLIPASLSFFLFLPPYSSYNNVKKPHELHPEVIMSSSEKLAAPWARKGGGMAISVSQSRSLAVSTHCPQPAWWHGYHPDVPLFPQGAGKDPTLAQPNLSPLRHQTGLSLQFCGNLLPFPCRFLCCASLPAQLSSAGRQESGRKV